MKFHNCQHTYQGYSDAHQILIDVYKNNKVCKSKLNYDLFNQSRRKSAGISPEFGNLFVGPTYHGGQYYITDRNCKMMS